MVETLPTYRGGARVVITTTGRFDYLAYEHAKRLVVEVEPAQPEPETEGYVPAFRYTGWRDGDRQCVQR